MASGCRRKVRNRRTTILGGTMAFLISQTSILIFSTTRMFKGTLQLYQHLHSVRTLSTRHLQAMSGRTRLSMKPYDGHLLQVPTIQTPIAITKLLFQ